MDRSVPLGVFGCIHVDDTEKVTAELSTFRENGDVMFIEYPSGSQFGFGDPSRAVSYPLELLAYLVLVLVHGPLYLLFNRDIFPAEYIAAAHLAEENDVALHAVDTPFLEYPRGWPAIALNWAGLALFCWLAPTAVGVTVGAILAAGIVPGLVRRFSRWLGVLTAVVVWGGSYAVIFWQRSLVLAVFLIVLVVALFARLSRAHEFRNGQMVDRVDSIAAREGYDRAVLVTGRAHVLGIVEQARAAGFDVDRAHLSAFRDEGETMSPVDIERLRERDDVDLEFPTPFSRPDADQRLVSPAPAQSVRRRRALAAVFDLASSFLLAVTVSTSLWGVPEAARSSPAATVGTHVVVMFTYYALLESIWATTPGKRLVGLYVTDRGGQRPRLWQVLLRTLARPVDLAIGLFLVVGSARQRRLGDIAAGTLVGYDADEDTESAVVHLDTDLDEQVIAAGSDRNSAGSRVVAACVDVVPAFVFGFVAFAMTMAFVSLAVGQESASAVFGDGQIFAGIICSAAVYHPLSVLLFGRTLGQRVTNLAVAATDGTVPDGYSLAVKQLLRPLDYVLFPVALLTIFLTAQKQRPSELLAGTVVGRANQRREEESTAETTADQPREPAEASPETVD